jgi:hypothetical protein
MSPGRLAQERGGSHEPGNPTPRPAHGRCRPDLAAVGRTGPEAPGPRGPFASCWSRQFSRHTWLGIGSGRLREVRAGLRRLGTSAGMRGLRLCCGLRAAGPHGPGLAALSLPGLRPTVRRGQRRAAEPDPMPERRHRSRGALALVRPPHAPGRSEMFLQRGITFGHETGRDWEAKRTPS